MTRIEFHCDRCGKHVTGLHTDTGTAGFYNVSPGSAWEAYAVSHDSPEWTSIRVAPEHFVCDSCIQAMPEYKAVYGDSARSEP